MEYSKVERSKIKIDKLAAPIMIENFIIENDLRYVDEIISMKYSKVARHKSKMDKLAAPIMNENVIIETNLRYIHEIISLTILLDE